MLPFKKILCPIDFSEPSHEALKVASELAMKFEAELTVIHAIPDIPKATPPDPAIEATETYLQYQRELERDSQRLLSDAVHRFTSHELKVREIIESGDAALIVAKIAEEEDADLVVLSTHGRTGWRRFVFGSVAERIVRHAQCPVLTIQTPHIAE
ncbi:universal stress protein [bacterium]|nr:universal stress protein [bacterium]MBU1984189.1 universal stress protein [bacterium]